MTDRYADLRAALGTLSAETEGRSIPWFDRRQVLLEEVTGEFDRELPQIPETDMAFIAAASPDAIRALLADYDRMRDALASIIDIAARPAVIEIARAALAQEGP